MLQTLRNWAKPKYPWKIWAIPFLLIGPAVFVIPNDVFTQYPWASTYTDFVASIVPMIDKASVVHPHPDRFRAFFAYAWTWIIPFFIFLNCMDTSKAKKIEIKMIEEHPFRVFLSLLLGGYGFYLFFFGVTAPVPAAKEIEFLYMFNNAYRFNFDLYSNDYKLLWSCYITVFGSGLMIWQIYRFIRLFTNKSLSIKNDCVEQHDCGNSRDSK